MAWAVWRHMAAGGTSLLVVLAMACTAVPAPTPSPGPTEPSIPASSAAPPGREPTNMAVARATLTAIVGVEQTATAAAPTPTVTPTLVPLLQTLPLPASHPMASTWILGPAPGVAERATRLAVTDDGDLIVLDSLLHKVARFDRTGQLAAAWGSQGTGPGQFTFQMEGGPRIQAMAVSHEGWVYVADATNRIQRFDAHGRLLAVLSRDGVAGGEGLVRRPGGLAVDRSGNLYVTDVDSHRVQKYDASGQPMLRWGIQGTGVGQFQSPSSITVDRQGHVYVYDTLGRIQKFDATGKVLAVWGVRGDGDAEFRMGATLATNAQGIVFATDSGNSRVQAFDSDGNYLLQWGSFGSEAGQMRQPSGIAVDGQGAIYVAETANQRIQKFTPRAAWPTTTKGTPTPRPPTPTATPTNPPMQIGPPPFMTPTDR